MRFAIIDACFPINRQSYGMAATWLRWELAKYGIDPVIPNESDCILITVVDPRQCDYVERVRRQFPDKFIAVGGAGALSPFSLGRFCDAVCVGEGRNFMKAIVSKGAEVTKLPETWVDGELRPVVVANGFPWDVPPVEREDGAYCIPVGRGCKKKCAFCQTGWGCEYEEHPNPQKILESIALLKGKKYAYLSNDPLQHSFWKMLPPVDHGSYSIDFMKINGVPPARQIRVGVEGVSERLRRAVGKPITNSDLVKSAAWLCAQGKSVRWFLIAGLPGESIQDWEELKDVVLAWKRICDKGVLALSFTAWQPEPASPLGNFAVEDNYWSLFCEFSDWFFSGRGWSNRIKIMKPAAPLARMASSVARMGLDEQTLRRGGGYGPNNRVKYPYIALRSAARQRYENIIFGVSGEHTPNSRLKDIPCRD